MREKERVYKDFKSETGYLGVACFREGISFLWGIAKTIMYWGVTCIIIASPIFFA
jgi:hypothetical protein